MSALAWALLLIIALAIIVTIYVFISAARLFGEDEASEQYLGNNERMRMKGYKHRALGDRRSNQDRRIGRRPVSFPLVDRFGYHISEDRRVSRRERRQMQDRRLQFV